jgi:hypothetical protein
MQFLRSEPAFHYRALRMISEGGAWELGLCPYSHGVRLRMGRIGRPPSVLDFCMGHDANLFLPVLTAVLGRLEPLAESASAKEIDAVFPWAGTRPDLAVHLDSLLGNASSSVGEFRC